LVDIWLAQTEASLAGWRDTILDAVGDHGQVLIDIVPALERVLGPQPDVPQLGGVENQNRINHFFNRFISCLATPEHPLVVFLDDQQWIDPASLNLIEALFAGQSANRLLVIGAYRSNEVDAAHPLAVSQDRMQAESDRVTVINLGDLPPDDTNHLLADSLQLSVADWI
jgi:predicted ATPase